MYARVPQAMAQFVLKIEKLSHIMGPTDGPTPILEMARAYGLRPRLWLLILHFSCFSAVFRVFLGCSGFSWGVPGFLGGVPGFLGVFLVFLGCSWFSWECSGFFGGVPGFSGVPECSVMFRCSGVPCSRVPVFLEVLHAGINVRSNVTDIPHPGK